MKIFTTLDLSLPKIQLKFFRNIFLYILCVSGYTLYSQIPKTKNIYTSFIDTAKIREYNKKNKLPNKEIKLDTAKTFANVRDQLSDTSGFKQRIQLNDSLNSIGTKSRLLKDSINKKLAKPKRDSSSNKIKSRIPDKNKALAFSGVISNQFDYGAIPYYLADNHFPASLFKSTGDCKLRVNKIPVKIEYFYSNPKYISGLNNYFTIKFDVEEYKKLTNNQELETARKMRSKMDSINKEKYKIKQQINFAELANQRRLRNFNEYRTFQVPTNNFSKYDTLSQFNTDTLKSSVTNSINSTKYELPSNSPGYSMPDTNTAKIKELKTKYDQLEKTSEDLQRKIDYIEYPELKSKSNKNPNFPSNKFANAMTGIKKFEIGMCYPNYSTFMINQMALQGANIKYELNKFFINASYGKTVSNYSVQNSQNQVIQQIQQMSNIFDWNKNPTEKKIGATKIGFGNENKNYFGTGILFGKGLVNTSSTDIKKNLVIEFDGRFAYKFIVAEGAYAKSYIFDIYKPPVQSESSAAVPQSKWSRTFQVKLYGTIPKLLTKISLSNRTIEPYFKSYGVGFMRSDVIRYESKLEQPFGKFVKVGFNYRQDQDNIKKLHDYQTVLQNYTYIAKIKLFKKKLDIILNYSNINQQTANLLSKENILVNTKIKTAIISYLIKRKELISTNTLMMNAYIINNLNSSSTFKNYTFNSFNSHKKLQVSFLNAYNQTTFVDSLSFTNAINNGIEIGYQFSDNIKVLVGGKHAYQLSSKISQFGYSTTIYVALHKLLSIELKAEKLVIGDYINTLNYSSVKKFPYYGYIKLISKF